jgi:hypothetical protein
VGDHLPGTDSGALRGLQHPPEYLADVGRLRNEEGADDQGEDDQLAPSGLRLVRSRLDVSGKK